MSDTKVKMKVYPNSEDSRVVLTLIEGDLVTPIRLSEIQASTVRRYLIGIYGAKSTQPAHIKLPDGRTFHFVHSVWAPMLEHLNKWYDDTHPAR